MKREFIQTVKGVEFASYPGLLDEAHGQGLVGISTEVLQFPSEDNGFLAVCKATVTIQQGEITKVFSGIGDAAPASVNKMMTNRLVAMAETRAKGRALRDAINIGVALYEDEPLSGEFEANHQDKPSYGARAEEAPRTDPPNPPSQGGGSGDPITEAQLNAIYIAGKSKRRMTEQQVDAKCLEIFGCLPKDLSKKRASDLIGMFNKK